MTAKMPLSEFISVSDVAWEEALPGIRQRHLWAHAETKRRAVMTRFESSRAPTWTLLAW